MRYTYIKLILVKNHSLYRNQDLTQRKEVL